MSVCVCAGEREPCASVNENPSVVSAGGGCSVPGRGCLLRWSQWSVEGVKLQAPGGRNLLYLFEDRDVAPLATSQILKLPKAAARGTWEGPCFCSRACCWFCGMKCRWKQTRAMLGWLDHCSSPQNRTWGSLLPLACGETLAPGQTLKPASLFPANLGIWTPLWCQQAGNLLMVLEEIHIPSSQFLPRCGAGAAFFVGSCTEVFQALAISSMTSEWVSGDLLGDGTFSAKSRVSPSQRPRGALGALHLVGCLKIISWESRNPALRKAVSLANQCFPLPVNPCHMEGALIVLPKDGPRPHQGESVPVGTSPFLFS